MGFPNIKNLFRKVKYKWKINWKLSKNSKHETDLDQTPLRKRATRFDFINIKTFGTLKGII